MSRVALIIGNTGAGKSHSIKFLDPASTFIVNVLQKDLPWKGSGKQYKPVGSGPDGNLLNTDDADKIIKTMKYVSSKMPHVKDLIIDDHTHIYANYFLGQAGREEKDIEAGLKPNIYKKFTHIAQFTLDIARTAKSLRPDLFVYIMHHVDDTSDMESDVTKKAASFGRFVEEKLKGIEAQFTVVLYAYKKADKDGNISGWFKTQDVTSTTKTPDGMFDESEIPNNLAYLREKIESYYDDTED